MPLASYRDKWTQVRWGIEDFRYRFGREPEGMWLPETAADRETLSVLAENGIKFTILAPHQAKRVRRIGGTRWRRVTPGSLNTTEVYRCFLGGNQIDIFFFNGSISYEVSFGRLLQSGETFAQRLKAALRPRQRKRQLLLVATDGETFGHHKPFGEMALAYTLSREAAKNGLLVTNLGEFIAENPPQWEVEIDE
jgi:alpha-amylase/alpha-mannosidase (GH57 family)